MKPLSDSYLEDPEPCSCDEALALKTERDTFRDLARHRGDLLVSEVERRLLAERACATTTERLYAQARTMMADQSRLAEATALLTRWKSDEPLGGIAERKLHADTSEFLWPSATPAQAAEPDSGVAAMTAIARAAELEQSECHPAYCKHPFPWPNPDTTFDELKAAYESSTIALRECSENLKNAMTILSSRDEIAEQALAAARAERDRDNEIAKGVVLGLRAERDTALARIAELEADYEKSRKELWAQAKAQSERIAELEAEKHGR